LVAVTPLTFTVTVAVPPKVPDTVTEVLRVSSPFAGALIVTVGGVTRVTVIEDVQVFPAASVAVTLMVFAPSASATDWLNAPPFKLAVVPFTFTLVIALASVTVPVTTTEAAPVVEPLAGALIAMTGAVLSSFTVTEADADPEAFVATAVSVLLPSMSGTLAE